MHAFELSHQSPVVFQTLNLEYPVLACQSAGGLREEKPMMVEEVSAELVGAAIGATADWSWLVGTQLRYLEESKQFRWIKMAPAALVDGDRWWWVEKGMGIGEWA